MTEAMVNEPVPDILIIDDTPDNLRFLNRILGKYFSVRLAPNATIGINAAKALVPDLILLDIMLPDLNGFEVISILKQDPRTAEVPIIFISALGDIESKVRAFEVGGVDYIEKPFKELEVVARVKSQIFQRNAIKRSQEELRRRQRFEIELRKSEERYRLLAENTSDVIWVINTVHRKFTYISPSIEQLRGFTVEEALDETVEETLEPEMAANVWEKLDRTAAKFAANPINFPAVTVEVQQVCKDGRYIWVELSMRFRATESGEIEIVGVSRNIDKRKKAEAELRLSEERHRLLADNSIDIIWTMSIHGDLSYISPSIQRILGYTQEEGLSLPSLENVFLPESWIAVKSEMDAAFQNARAQRPIQFQALAFELKHKNGSTVWLEVTATGIYTADGRFIEILGIARDISERKKDELTLKQAHDELAGANLALQNMNTELNRLATTDPLTGIWNRRHLQEALEQEITRAQRYSTPLSIILFDIDHFKTVNDKFGHKIGDQVLIELCQRVQSHVRASDQFARWGGEEFALVLPHSGKDEAIILAKKLRALIGTQPFQEAGNVTVSLGVAIFRPAENSSEWFTRADKALYSAKMAGRNCVRIAN